MGIDNFTEIGFAGLAAGILWMTFRWMTMELNKKIDNLQNSFNDVNNELKTTQQQLHDVHQSWQEQVYQLADKDKLIEELTKQNEELQRACRKRRIDQSQQAYKREKLDDVSKCGSFDV